MIHRHSLIQQLDDELKGGQGPLLELSKQLLTNLTQQQAYQFSNSPNLVHELVQERTLVIDQLLARIWHHFISRTDIALIAVGGYGRGELFPQSDIDLLVLSADPITADELNPFLNLLWDCRLKLGYSVRTLDECLSQAQLDATIATTLIESRFLAGSWEQYQKLQKLASKDHLMSSKAFFEVKLKEQSTRYEKFEDNAYNVEPNLKESPGGLRDIHSIGWIAKFHFGSTELIELKENNFLTEREYKTLEQSLHFLWQIRFALHTLCNRPEERLLFDYQRQLARQFGYKDTHKRLGVERFMHKYYRTANRVQQLNELLLQLFREMIFDTHDEPARALNRRFQIRHNYLETVNASVFRKSPFALLEVFLILSQNPDIQGIKAKTIRQIQGNLFRIDEAFRNNFQNKSLFLEIFRQPQGLTRVMRRMSSYGVLGAYIPAFHKITGLMQFDLFHAYTVDAHTILVVRNLRRFFIPEFQNELPHAHQIALQIPKPEILYLAGLFHDIAKGRGGDHEILGADDALLFCKQHAMSDYDAQLVAWLVRHHLDMSSTSQKKDISNPTVIHEFAKIAQDPSWLDYLYLLTVADMRATSPKVWNSWKNSLLIQLLDSAKHQLQNHRQKPVKLKDHIEERKAKTLKILTQCDISIKDCEELWTTLGTDYFQKHRANEIAWHTQEIIGREEFPAVSTRSSSIHGSSQIMVYMPDQDFIFATMIRTLDMMHYQIMDAKLFKTEHQFILNTINILNSQGELVNDFHELQTIEQAILNALQNPVSYDELCHVPVNHFLDRKIKSFTVSTEVSIKEMESELHIDITTRDRPGLLRAMTAVFCQFKMKIIAAKIHTEGARAEDQFIVSTEGLETPQLRQALIDALKHQIEV
jgi:[protein-PII] uridylyltransferase